jgi:hypothetical protein
VVLTGSIIGVYEDTTVATEGDIHLTVQLDQAFLMSFSIPVVGVGFIHCSLHSFDVQYARSS